ncbi:LuxR C-terminal-related transcriptional regulator [Cribrihabitans neustonicus]|uniref:LuxR C-terminal-related transcriptional regulator n=1 Tax=Cribrihabitans neustonicus TaxID=1429085 RepID=UPI003B5ADA8C
MPGKGPRRAHFVIVEKQRLWQECLSHSIGLLHPGVSLACCDSIDGYLAASPPGRTPDAVILCLTQAEMREGDSLAAARRLVKAAAPVPVVVLSDCEEIGRMAAVLECGVNGYIPASIGLKGVVDAIRTAASGGFLLTGPALEDLRQAILKEKPAAPPPCTDRLTSRQSAVAEALRQGKPNKTIAFELGMCENTVKVHVRNILKKLNVVNRTEAAFKLNQLHTRH